MLTYGCDVCRRIEEQKGWGERQRGKRESEKERDRKREISYATREVNRVTFAPRRKLERAQWEFNEARRRRKPSQEMEHLSSVSHPWEVARYCFCFFLFFFRRKRARERYASVVLYIHYRRVMRDTQIIRRIPALYTHSRIPAIFTRRFSAMLRYNKRSDLR